MKSKKHMIQADNKAMIDGMLFCIKTFSIACTSAAIMYFAIELYNKFF